MTNKTGNQFFFDVNLDWLENTKGILSSKNANGTIQVATPKEFGGEGNEWTPEHFFLSAISSCFMTTFLSFTKKLHFEIKDFKCEIIGQLEIVDGKYKFTNINLYPKVYLFDETLRDKTNVALEKTHKYCLITNSVNATVLYHDEIIIDNKLALEQDQILC